VLNPIGIYNRITAALDSPVHYAQLHLCPLAYLEEETLTEATDLAPATLRRVVYHISIEDKDPRIEDLLIKLFKFPLICQYYIPKTVHGLLLARTEDLQGQWKEKLILTQVRTNHTSQFTAGVPFGAFTSASFVTSRNKHRTTYTALKLAQVLALWHPEHSHLASALSKPFLLPRAQKVPLDERAPKPPKHNPLEMDNAADGNNFATEAHLAALIEQDRNVIHTATIQGTLHEFSTKAALSPYSAWSCLFLDIKAAHRVVVRYMKIATIIHRSPLARSKTTIDSNTRSIVNACPKPTEVQNALLQLITDALSSLGAAMSAELPIWWTAIGLSNEEAEKLKTKQFWRGYPR
jgi:hypothetical protein